MQRRNFYIRLLTFGTASFIRVQFLKMAQIMRGCGTSLDTFFLLFLVFRTRYECPSRVKKRNTVQQLERPIRTFEMILASKSLPLSAHKQL